MNDTQKQLYKNLIKTYYEPDSGVQFNALIEKTLQDDPEMKNILSILCGVEALQDDKSFAHTLANALTKQNVREKIIYKVTRCSTDCISEDGKSKCQSVCPFDAIMKDKAGEKWIDETLCMSCGKCVAACEKGNYIDVPQFLPLAALLKEHQPVVAIVAPAIAGQFGEGVQLDQLREAFIQIGFKDMVEVAVAADILSFKEALEFDAHVKKKGDFMITSCCCPMWVAALRKVYHELIPELSPSVSPMIAMARVLKAIDNSVKVVFVGPCIAKKAEAKEKDLIGAVDYVLTFEELKLIFETLGVNPAACTGVPTVDYASTGGRLYAHTGGVSQAIKDIVDELFPEKSKLFDAVQADGMKNCKTLLEALQKGEHQASFIEGMGCNGGCVGGPKAIISAEEGRKAVDKTAYESAIKIPIHSEVLVTLLKQIGVTDPYTLMEGHSLFERSFK